MRTFWLILLIGVGLCFTTVPVAFSQEMDQMGAEQASGQVVSLNPVDSTIVVKDSKVEASEEMTFFWNSDTQIKKADVVLAASDIKVGDEVSVEYTMEADGKMVANAVWVK